MSNEVLLLSFLHIFLIKSLIFLVLSHVQLFVTPWTVAHQAPLSMEFSRQEYWSELPSLPPGNLRNAGSEPKSLAWVAIPYSRGFSPPRDRTCVSCVSCIGRQVH